MARLPDIADLGMSADQQRVHDAILGGPRGVVEGPLRIWLHSPDLAEKAQQLGAFCRYGTSLPPRLSELAILLTGAYWRAGFEWHVHAPIAIKAGISADAAETIRRGEEPELLMDDEKAVCAFVTELYRNRSVSSVTHAAALRQLGEKGVVELVGILGYYALISMTIVAFEVPVPQGAEGPFADLGD